MSELPVTFFILLGVVLMTLLYGLYLILFVHSLFYFSRKKRSRMTRTNKLIVLAAILIFLITTAQWIFVVIQAISPFTKETASTDTAQTDQAFLAGVSGTANIANLALFVCEIIISDIVMIYRLWIVSHHNRYMVAPTGCLFVISIVFGALYLNNTSELSSGADLFHAKGAQWLIVGLSCSVATNIYCTVMLSYKIWQSQQAIRQAGAQLSIFSVSRMLAIIIESAALYTASTFTLLITYAFGSLGSWIVQDMGAPIAGIAYSLIIIRFGMGGAFRRRAQLSSVTLSTSQPSSSSGGNAIPMKPLNVHINVDRETLETCDNGVEDSVINIDNKDYASSTV